MVLKMQTQPQRIFRVNFLNGGRGAVLIISTVEKILLVRKDDLGYSHRLLLEVPWHSLS